MLYIHVGKQLPIVYTVRNKYPSTYNVYVYIYDTYLRFSSECIFFKLWDPELTQAMYACGQYKF